MLFRSMEYKGIFAVLSEFIDKDRCFDYVAGINSTDRWFNFPMFERTAAYCADKMKEAGLEEVEMLPLKADGHTPYGDWVIPQAWDATKGILKVESPVVENPVLADYQSTSFSLVMYSAPTPAGGIAAEVVIVDDPASVKPEEVKGKLIFTGKKPQTVVDLALEGKAAGIISDFFPMYKGIREDRSEVYDAFRWENSFMCPINSSGLFGFSISPRNGDFLRELVSKAVTKGETVTLHAEVDSRFYDGVSYTVSGLIPGTDKQGEEVFIFGHLYEPGANDNASGCGTILEVAAAINKAIAAGKLPRLRRGLRFAMGFECGGSMGYVEAHPDRVKRTVAADRKSVV